MKWVMIFAPIFFANQLAVASAAPIDLLKDQQPSLFRLYQEGKAYVPALEMYAQRQGFRAPVENIATVVHELVHIYSTIHQGFLIDGKYFEPHLRRDAWPSLSNKDLIGNVLPTEMSNIYSVYAGNTPNNHLGNVVDELNAHSQVAGFICRNEPASGDKQVRNITGHLLLQEAFIRNVRIRTPDEYLKLARSRESRGAIFTVTNNAWAALAACGYDPRLVAHGEVSTLLSLPQ